MKAHIEPKSKECPFCGASTYEVMSGTGVKILAKIFGCKDWRWQNR